jgi:hypothetical protein
VPALEKLKNRSAKPPKKLISSTFYAVVETDDKSAQIMTATCYRQLLK